MRGFTLIEMLMALVIVAILAGLAAPSFREMNHRNRLAGTVNEYITALNLARSEAVKRGNPVTLCRSGNPNANPPACGGGAGWETGWVVFSDPANTGTVDAGEAIISVRGSLGAELLLRSTGLLADRLTFASTGTPPRPNNGTLRLCRAGNPEVRHIVLSMTGRPRVEKITGGACP